MSVKGTYLVYGCKILRIMNGLRTKAEKNIGRIKSEKNIGRNRDREEDRV